MMEARSQHNVDRVSATHPDWATLTERALDDLSRIVRSEIAMFQTSMAVAVEAQMNNVTARLATIAAVVLGAVCILCASILLLHQWLPLWQAFAIAGTALIVTGIFISGPKVPRGT
jgi:VIT1/CCC1 family predicted Fe2+/Mn2+ transporter